MGKIKPLYPNGKLSSQEPATDEQIEKVQKWFRDEFLIIQAQRDEAIKELKCVRGFLYPNELEYKTYKNPTLKIKKTAGQSPDRAYQELEKAYGEHMIPKEIEGQESVYNYASLRGQGLSCLKELKRQRDAARLEIIQWKLFRGEEI